MIRGVGEIDLLGGEPSSQRNGTPYLEKPYEECPYLLLDVRDNDEYKACHITGGTMNFWGSLVLAAPGVEIMRRG